MKPKGASRRFTTWLLAAAFLAFMGFVVYRSLQVAGYQCSVCISFRGQSACRTVAGPTEREALMGATTNACAFLASGVTDSLACGRTPPTKVECTATN